MSDSKIRWKRSVAGTRIGYILERFSHNEGPFYKRIDGEVYLVSKPVWVPVTTQDEEGRDTSATLFVGTGEFTNDPRIKTEPNDIFEVALDTVENAEDVTDG